jgi:aldose 1-epimerase
MAGPRFPDIAGGHRPVVLADSRAEAVVLPEMGGGLAAYDWHGRDGLQPIFRCAPADAAHPFQLACNLLVPWSGRISGGGFTLNGAFHPIAPNLPGEPLPIHGGGFAVPWTVTAVDALRARLTLTSDGPGPFRYDAAVDYVVDDGALTVTLTAINRAAQTLPYGLGLHPWLPRTPGTTLRAASDIVWFEDARHIPCGSAPTRESLGWDFGKARTLPPGWINNWFSGWPGRAEIVWPERGIALDITADPPFSGYVIYSPGASADFFCFEPVSHVADAHNLPGGPQAHGLVLLPSGGTLTATAQFAPRSIS